MKPQTIPALLAHGVENFAECIAIADGDLRMTYAQLADEVNRVSRAYLALGITPGDRIAIWVPNRAEYILALLGAQNIGAVVVPLNTRYRGHEARTILDRSRASVLVTVQGFLGNDYIDLLAGTCDVPDSSAIRDGLFGLPSLHTVVDIAESGHPQSLGWTDFLHGGEAVLQEAVDQARADVTTETIADILFTSGTTGLPKGVMSAHRQTLGVAQVWADGANLTQEDRYAIVNPFFHGFGYKAGVIAALTAGTAIYPLVTFDPVAIMELIQEERITVLPGAPTIFITLINHPRREQFDLSSLRFSIAGATTVPESLFEQMLDVLGFKQVAQAYGLTECVVATVSRPNEDPRHIAECTGPAVPGLEIKTVDPDGNTMPTGSEGEIWIRGDNVMLGYFEDPDATAAAIDSDGWFHSGDVGKLDEHGCLKITDRIKDLFIVGGFNVYPAEVENVLVSHPDVIEAAVIGVDDERMGAVGLAYVSPRPGVTLDLDALTAFCRERLANFKVPRSFEVLAEFPRNASGKVLKTDLRKAVR